MLLLPLWFLHLHVFCLICDVTVTSCHKHYTQVVDSKQHNNLLMLVLLAPSPFQSIFVFRLPIFLPLPAFSFLDNSLSKYLTRSHYKNTQYSDLQFHKCLNLDILNNLKNLVVVIRSLDSLLFQPHMFTSICKFIAIFIQDDR